MAYRTQEDSLLTRLLFIIKEYNSETATWKRAIGQGMWEGAQSSHALSRYATLSARVQQAGGSLNSIM